MKVLTASHWMSLLAASLVLACSGTQPRVPLTKGSPAPSFTLETTAGERIDSASLHGQPVVVAFWATWCLPCLEEIPLLAEIDSSGQARVVAIALDEDGTEVVASFQAKNSIPYLVVLGNEATFRSYDGLAIPYTIVLDADLRVVSNRRGRLDRETLSADLREAESSGLSRL
ncbi:MAG: TlpA family protein disulfide reductase [Thermoanaerobaculia bacterium]|nr:TlpA family protein disulfide reductase [Thermoanaerobaculia bacterium]